MIRNNINIRSKSQRTSKKLYDKIHEINNNKKESIINKLNDDRQDPPKFLNTETAYIKTKNRSKDLPKFKKTTIIKESDIKLETNKGTYHKSCTRKPKTKRNLSFQGKDEDNTSVDNPASHEM